MNFWIRLILGVGFISVCSCVNAKVRGDCNVPEMIEGYDSYNELVCSGFRYLEEQKYKEAIKSFEIALAIHLPDAPNFELFPQLAWAYFKAGDVDNAEATLATAELSLSVFSGILQCEETDHGFYLRDYDGIRLTNGASIKVAAIMCGAAYDSVYERRSLERVLLEAEIAKRYFEIKEKMLKK